MRHSIPPPQATGFGGGRTGSGAAPHSSSTPEPARCATNPSDATFWDTVDEIRMHDERLSREAYGFVVAAVGWTVQGLPGPRRDDPVRRHLSGAELLMGMSDLARREFGVLARTVFREWGIRSNEDVGRLVFQLIERGCLSAQPEDSLQDFLAAPDVLESLAAGDAPLGASHPGGDEILPER